MPDVTGLTLFVRLLQPTVTCTTVPFENKGQSEVKSKIFSSGEEILSSLQRIYSQYIKVVQIPRLICSFPVVIQHKQII